MCPQSHHSLQTTDTPTVESKGSSRHRSYSNRGHNHHHHHHHYHHHFNNGKNGLKTPDSDKSATSPRPIRESRTDRGDRGRAAPDEQVPLANIEDLGAMGGIDS